MRERDTIDAAHDPDDARMNALLVEVGGIKHVVADNMFLRERLKGLRREGDALAAENDRLWEYLANEVPFASLPEWMRDKIVDRVTMSKERS